MKSTLLQPLGTFPVVSEYFIMLYIGSLTKPECCCAPAEGLIICQFFLLLRTTGELVLHCGFCWAAGDHSDGGERSSWLLLASNKGT